MISLGLALSMALSLGVPASAFIQPSVGTTWDYPLGYSLTASNADSKTKFYSVDLVNTAQSDITSLKAAGHIIACYFSGGSREKYRTDANQFPASAVGKVLDGYPDENWVDVRNQKIRDIMVARIALAQSKGCDGVDVDNIDGYSNDSGFPLKSSDAVSFIKYLATAAHAKGMAYGLKNGGDLVSQVVNDVQWEINEQCAEYTECDAFKPLIAAGKPVFHVEYTKSDTATTVDPTFLAQSCSAGGNTAFSSIVKHVTLDQFIKKC